MRLRQMFGQTLCLVALIVSACSEDDDSMPEDADSGQPETDAGTEEDSSAPPLGAAALGRWLRDGEYLTWRCEPTVHASRSPSPHGYNRICSNQEISDHAEETGPFPKGAAAVKELYASADAKEPIGYSVYVKTEADSADGANWYWYERVASGSAASNDTKGVVADGMGDRGPAKTICVGCHIAAGRDAAHTPSPGGRDQVYTPVR